MSILKYFSVQTSKGGLPSPSGPLQETIPPLTIAAVNKKVEAELASLESKKRGQYTKFTPSQRAMIGKKAAEEGVTASMRYFKAKYPNLDLKETTVRRFKNLYLDEIKLQKEIEIKEIATKNEEDR